MSIESTVTTLAAAINELAKSGFAIATAITEFNAKQAPRVIKTEGVVNGGNNPTTGAQTVNENAVAAGTTQALTDSASNSQRTEIVEPFKVEPFNVNDVKSSSGSSEIKATVITQPTTDVGITEPANTSVPTSQPSSESGENSRRNNGDEATEANVEKAYTVDEVKAALIETVQLHGKAKVSELLAAHGATRLPELAVEKYGKFIAACQSL